MESNICQFVIFLFTIAIVSHISHYEQSSNYLGKMSCLSKGWMWDWDKKGDRQSEERTMTRSECTQALGKVLSLGLKLNEELGSGWPSLKMMHSDECDVCKAQTSEIGLGEQWEGMAPTWPIGFPWLCSAN
jgi:hypothetical protein